MVISRRTTDVRLVYPATIILWDDVFAGCSNSLATAKPGLCHVDVPTLGSYYCTLLWWCRPEACELRVEGRRSTDEMPPDRRGIPIGPGLCSQPSFMSALEYPSGEHGVTSLIDRHRHRALLLYRTSFIYTTSTVIVVMVVTVICRSHFDIFRAFLPTAGRIDGGVRMSRMRLYP